LTFLELRLHKPISQDDSYSKAKTDDEHFVTKMAALTSSLRSSFLLLFASFVALSVYASPLRYGSRFDVIERRGCGTHFDLETRAEIEEALVYARSEMDDNLYIRDDKEAGKGKDTTERNLEPVSFDVYWHIVYANETKEGGYVSDERIQQQMTVLNDDYKSTNISWNLKNVTRIESEDWFTNVWPGSKQEKEMKAQYHKGDSTALNIFTAQFNATTKSLGFSSLPSTYLRDPLSDGVMIRHSTLPGGDQPNYSHGRTTVHEVGHWLGLYHTFEGGCEGVGDNIMDTAPEASESVGCPVGRKSCPDSKLEDPIHNFMDYSWDTCMTHFTPGQAKRMHEVIWAYRTKRPSTSNSTASVSSTSVDAVVSAPATSSTASASPAAVTDTSEEPEGKGEEATRGWEDDEVDALERFGGEGDLDSERALEGEDGVQERLWDDEFYQ